VSIGKLAAARAFRRPAFTLPELLVSMGVVAVLLAVALPSLGWGKRAALETGELAHQRESGRELERFITDHQERFPYFGIPGTEMAEFRYGMYGFTWYWHQSFYWGLFIETKGYRGVLSCSGPASDWPVRASYGDGGPIHSMDYLSKTAFASPRYWARGGPQDVRDHQPQRASIVAFPSQKGLLLRLSLAMEQPKTTDESRRWLVFFADGHGSVYRFPQLTPGVPHLPWGEHWPVMQTEDGLLGRDIQ